MKLLSEMKKQLEDLHLENEILKTEVETYKRRYHSAQQMQQQMQQQILQQQVNTVKSCSNGTNKSYLL